MLTNRLSKDRRFLFVRGKFLIKTYGTGNTEGVGNLQLFLKRFPGIKKGKDDLIILNPGKIMAAQAFVEIAAIQIIPREATGKFCPVFYNGYVFLTERSLQPDFPALPWGEVFFQRHMQGIGAQKYGAREVSAITFGYADRAR